MLIVLELTYLHQLRYICLFRILDSIFCEKDEMITFLENGRKFRYRLFVDERLSQDEFIWVLRWQMVCSFRQ